LGEGNLTAFDFVDVVVVSGGQPREEHAHNFSADIEFRWLLAAIFSEFRGHAGQESLLHVLDYSVGLIGLDRESFGSTHEVTGG
jgi:hypothetical protein